MLGGLILLQFLPWPEAAGLEPDLCRHNGGDCGHRVAGAAPGRIRFLFARALAAIWLLSALILAVLVWWRYRSGRSLLGDPALVKEDAAAAKRSSRSSWQEVIFLLLWLIAAGWLFFRPHESIMGGADAGVYVSLGAEIAQQGGFQIVDETLASA